MKGVVAGLAFANMILLSGCIDSNQTEQAGAMARDATEAPTDVVGSQSGPTRTDEELQSVFHRNRTRLYEVYQQYLKEQPTLQGNVHLRITIEPNGTVSECSIESTDIPSEALLADIVDGIKQFDFGAKASVPRTTIIYPIDFLPAS